MAARAVTCMVTAGLALGLAGCSHSTSNGSAPEAKQAAGLPAAEPAAGSPPVAALPGGAVDTSQAPAWILPSASASAEEAAGIPVPPGKAWMLTPGGRVVTFADGKQPTREIHVSASAPAGGDGSKEKPFSDFRTAVKQATPGTAVIVHPGRYRRSWLERIPGTAEAPIWIGGAPGEERPIFDDPAGGLHFSGRYFVLHDMEITGNPTNGINIDDDSNYDNPDHTRYVILRNIHIHTIGGSGNQDCLKLSGVHDFAVLDSDISRCGGEGKGSGIDMVGCHRGVIAGTRFTDLDGSGAQIKGGSTDILVLGNRFERSGARVINMGGMTTFKYFRPPLSSKQNNAEARRIRAIGNEIIGGIAPIAFVGCVDCLAANNTIVNPERWAFRILQETTSNGSYTFEPAQKGRFANNLIYYSAAQWKSAANIGPNTAPETFTLERNLWFAHDQQSSALPGDLPVSEERGIFGQNPALRAVPDDLRICASSPAAGQGALVAESVATGRFGAALPIGAHAPIACN